MEHNTIFTGRNEVVAKVMFLQVSVILSTGGESLENPPRTRQTPPRDQGEPPPQTKENPPRTKENPPPPGTKETPPGPRRTLPPGTKENPSPPGPRRTPPRDQGDPPPDQADTPLPREEDCSIRSMSGRYASYWNAILFYKCLKKEIIRHQYFLVFLIGRTINSDFKLIYYEKNRRETLFRLLVQVGFNLQHLICASVTMELFIAIKSM